LKKLTVETQKCILFSTHDIDLAIQLSDEMIVMTKEKVLQNLPCNLILDGTFSNLFSSENILFDSEKGKFIIR
jgi:iron complex transport system ATP-binding protein